MPRLLLFAPCERVILDTEGLVSLITVVEKLEVTIPQEVQLPARTAVPMRLQSIAIWQLDPPDIGQYEQMIQLITEDGIVAAHTEPAILASTLPGKTGAKIISTISHIPITDGAITIKLFHRKLNAQQWTESAWWEVSVVLVRN